MSLAKIETAVDALHSAETALDELRALAQLRRLVDELIPITATLALRTESAADVGRALGITRQAASKRFAVRRNAA